MKLVVNASTLSLPLTGIGRYTRYLLEQLMLREEVAELTGLLPLKSLNREQLIQRIALCDNYQHRHSDSPQAPSLKQRAVKVARQMPVAHQVKRVMEQTLARYHSRQHKDAVYWEPNYLLLPLDIPAVSTVYDLSHLVYPEYHPAARVKLLDSHLGKSIELSQKIVVISEFTRQEVMQHYSVAPEKIAVVPPAVSDAFRQTPDAVTLQGLRQRYDLPENFILSVCTLEPRKNLLGLMQAFCQLPDALRAAYPLVLVGARGWKNEQLDPILDQLRTRGELIQLGYVAQQDLPLLFSAAELLVYVSLYEGYGMPIAEAMAAGTAVITSNCTSMPEVANGACTLVDPHDSEATSQAMQQLLEDRVLRQQHVEQGLEKSAAYTWEHSAATLFNTMNSI